MPETNSADREDFERWASGSVGQPSFSGFHAEGGVWVYRHHIMQLMWECWRAARRTVVLRPRPALTS